MAGKAGKGSDNGSTAATPKPHKGSGKSKKVPLALLGGLIVGCLAAFLGLKATQAVDEKVALVATNESKTEEKTATNEFTANELPFLDEEEYNAKCPPPSVLPGDVKNKWWNRGGGLKFESKHVLQITTKNFNATVTNTKIPNMLIAFYDPRSESLKAVRHDLDKTADELARLRQSGESLGRLGACDVTVQTYLGNQEAQEELQSGWQQSRTEQTDSFRFGKPRFFPMILMFYREGKRLGEFTGVLSPKYIVHFLRLQKRQIGGSNVSDAKKLDKFLNGPGPIALACGLVNGSLEFTAFNETAHRQHGNLAFGIVPQEVCAKGLQLEVPGPQVVWIRGEGAPLSSERNIHIANSSVASNDTLLENWLMSFKADILEEITPDNSHKYLSEGSPPLALVLLDVKDTAARSKAEAMLEPIEKELQPDFNLVWADCAEFAPQFEVKKKECPIVLLVDSASLEYEKNTLKNLTSGDGTPSARLTSWMYQTPGYQRFKAFKAYVNKRLATASGENASAIEGQGANSTLATRNDSSNLSGSHSEVQPDTGRYSDHINDYDGSESVSVEEYQHLLMQLHALRTSYRKKYGSIPFNFSLLDRAERLHPHMRQLFKSEDEVLSSIDNMTKLTHLWGAIEQRSEFISKARDHFRNVNHMNESKPSKNVDWQVQDFPRLLRKGTGMLSKLFRKLFETLHKRVREGTMGVPKAPPREIPRRAASDLSVQEFFEKYARPSKPVIITGLNITEGDPWTLDFFKQRCFNKSVELRKFKEHSRTWGRLQHGGRLLLQDFIDTFTTNETRSEWYLHDWSLPLFCPEVFGPPPFREFTIPKYFAGDYFQRAGFEGYQHTWPSLFIGSEKTESKMHIDSGNTNFWLHLLSGRKEWRIYPRLEMVNIYQDMTHAHFWHDVFNPDIERFPLIEYAEMYHGIQEAGELVFIPGGNPHAVRNLEAIHGISMNYADTSNVGRYLLDAIGNEKWRSVEMFTDGITIPSGIRSDQEPLSFGEWKSVPWHALKYDIQTRDYQKGNM